MLSSLWDYLDPGFIAPVWLLAGLVVTALLAWLEYRAWQSREKALRTFAAAHLLGALTASISQPKRVLKSVLLVTGIALLFLALARPYLLFDWSDEQRSGLDVLIAVDCSRSMLTTDVRPSRLERAKLAIADFAEHLPENRLGLIAFAGDAFLQCPLTLDHDAFLSSVRSLSLDSIPRPGTDIAAAIDEAVDALHSQPKNLKFLILVTDGEDLEGRVATSARNAAQAGLRIYTIGVGTPAGERVPESDQLGSLGYHHDANGQEVVSRLDEAGLHQIAELTGGAYVPLGQRGEGLDEIYDHNIASLPKQNLEERRQKIHIERFEWPLTLAILLLVAQFLINDRVAVAEAPAPEAARRGMKRRSSRAVIAAAALLVVLAIPVFGAELDQAERDYKSGQYEQAMQGYQKAAVNNPAREELQFNHGDAAYKAGQFTEAEEAYRATLETPDLGLQEQTYYNLGNTQYQHGVAMRKVSSRKTVKLWESALHSYECALKLKDSKDTRHNYDVVKKKLEELKEQRKQRGKKGASQPGQGPPSNDPQAPPGQGPQGEEDADDSDDGDGDGQNSGGQKGPEQKGSGSGDSDKNGASAGDENKPMRTYSGTRKQDLKDPGIRSTQDAENLLDSLKDSERHITARAMKGGNSQPPPSGKDW